MKKLGKIKKKMCGWFSKLLQKLDRLLEKVKKICYINLTSAGYGLLCAADSIPR